MAGNLMAICAKSIRRIRIPFGAAANSEWKAKIGQREIVGFGFNGQPNYVDRLDFPFPAIRWKETTGDICALREKEKGDWRKLTAEDKKMLYRASFRQTLSELKAPSGEWKSVFGFTFMLVSLGVWLFYFVIFNVQEARPDSFKPERQKAQLRRMIDLQVDIITGTASKWDYEKNDWK